MQRSECEEIGECPPEVSRTSLVPPRTGSEQPGSLADLPGLQSPGESPRPVSKIVKPYVRRSSPGSAFDLGPHPQSRSFLSPYVQPHSKFFPGPRTFCNFPVRILLSTHAWNISKAHLDGCLPSAVFLAPRTIKSFTTSVFRASESTHKEVIPRDLVSLSPCKAKSQESLTNQSRKHCTSVAYDTQSQTCSYSSKPTAILAWMNKNDCVPIKLYWQNTESQLRGHC